MKVAIHQPQYLPYGGFFHKLSLSDLYVVMDDAQYDKRFTNRNRIITPNGLPPTVHGGSRAPCRSRFGTANLMIKLDLTTKTWDN